MPHARQGGGVRDPASTPILIMGEFQTLSLASWFPDLLEPGAPRGLKGSAVVQLVAERLARGWPTEVVTLDPTLTEPWKKWETDGLTLWVVKRRPRRVLRDAFRTERRLLHAVMKQSKAALCHAHWAYEYGVAAVTQPELPSVVTLHDHAGDILRISDARYLPLYAMTRYTLKKARCITAVAPHVADYASRISGTQVHLVPNLLQRAFWPDEPAEPDREKPYILALAGASRLKNLRRALQAFQQVRPRFPELCFRVAGPGLEEGGAFHAQCRQAGLDQAVEYLGFVDPDNARQWMRGCTLLWHPSLVEACPMSVAEAMAQHTPVLASREAHGSTWLLDHGSAGHLVPGRNMEAMARGLEHMLSNPLERAKLARVAFDRARELFAPDRVLGAYHAVYENRLGYTGRGP